MTTRTPTEQAIITTESEDKEQNYGKEEEDEKEDEAAAAASAAAEKNACNTKALNTNKFCCASTFKLFTLSLNTVNKEQQIGEI